MGNKGEIPTALRKAVNRLKFDGKISKDGDLVDLLGYQKSTISAYLSGSQSPSPEFIEKFTNKFGVMLEEERDKVHEPATSRTDITTQSLLNLTESNRLLAEAHKDFAEANKTLAKNNEELIRLLKEPTANSREQNPSAFDTMLQGLQELLLEVATGKKYLSKEEAAAALMNKYVPDETKRQAARSIPNN